MEEVTTRLDEDELALVDRLAEEIGSSRGDAVRRAVGRGVREALLRVALGEYREGDVGMRGVAGLADLSIAEAMAEANERNVPTNYGDEELANDVENLR